jgi:NAD(P)-dependent dehydrogenase (short-subunit alcohol dehydrogenase family)
MDGGTPGYRVSKAALNALTRMLAGELRCDRILVNAVCPGWAATDWAAPAAGRWPRARPASCGPWTCPTAGRLAASSATATRSPDNTGQHYSAAHTEWGHACLMTVRQVGWMLLRSITPYERWVRQLP